MPQPADAALHPPQGSREPPTAAELRAWERWKHMAGTADATGRQRARNAVLGALEHHARDNGTQVAYGSAREALESYRQAQETQRAIMDHAEQTRQAVMNCAGDTANHAAETQRVVLTHAGETARRSLLFTAETVALVLSVAAASWLLAQAGQYLGLTYGVRAYQVWSGVAHGIPDDSGP